MALTPECKVKVLFADVSLATKLYSLFFGHEWQEIIREPKLILNLQYIYFLNFSSAPHQAR